MNFGRIFGLWMLVQFPLSQGTATADDSDFHFKNFPSSETSKTSETPTPANSANSSVVTSTSYVPQAGDDPKDLSTHARRESAPVLRVDTEPREPYGLGASVNVYGGAVALQEGTLKITSPEVPGAELRGSSRDEAGEVSGIRMAFTWGSFNYIGDGRDALAFSPPTVVEPSVGGDFFWSHYRYQARGSGTTNPLGVPLEYNGTLSADTNAYTFCVEPMVRFNLGAFRPYVGFGIGGTYIDADEGSFDGNLSALNGRATGKEILTGSSSDLDFTVEGLAGFEYFFDEHWALGFDYKYLYLVSPTFHGDFPGARVDYKLSGLGESMFTSGFSYYF